MHRESDFVALCYQAVQHAVCSGWRYTPGKQAAWPGGCGAPVGAALADGHVSLHLALEHVTIEKGRTRGGSTAPPGKKKEKNRVFREATGRMAGNATRFKLKRL